MNKAEKVRFIESLAIEIRIFERLSLISPWNFTAPKKTPPAGFHDVRDRSGAIINLLEILVAANE